MSDFAFTPATLHLTAGEPVRLVLTSSGSGRHDFSAPAFFAAARVHNASTLPVEGDVLVEKGKSVQIDLIPGDAGYYDPDCSEFLHSAFGMTSGMDVIPAA